MTTKVISIAGARSAARRHVNTLEANTRLTVLLGLAVGLLIIIGLGAMRSASSVAGIELEGNGWAFVTRQVLAMGVGLVAWPFCWLVIATTAVNVGSTSDSQSFNHLSSPSSRRS
jgi:cell division protein FtsW (lipid II flippase)